MRGTSGAHPCRVAYLMPEAFATFFSVRARADEPDLFANVRAAVVDWMGDCRDPPAFDAEGRAYAWAPRVA